ncbi:MAG TPA: hypothetical protein VHE35_00550 [Kofleriaceae bacterium]|nr:hypothetical protein [Kofleriaceae bacterium]
MTRASLSPCTTLLALALAAAGGACGSGGAAPGPDAATLPAWHKDLPPASVMGVRRGLTPARGIIHLHSPYSHDACDYNPRPGGVPDETCLSHLRAALCSDRIDFAALSDHDDSMADEEFAALLLVRGSDELVQGKDGPIASRLHCDDGHQVLLTVGSENPIMPIMLDRHVTGTVAERHDIYNADTPEAVAAFRDAGATVWIPHTEQRTTPQLVTLAPDGIEIYNLHANIDPNIRRDYLGLSPDGAITAALGFAGMDADGPEPDLALLSFLLPSTPALTRWNELLAMGIHVAGSAGTDAHENSLPIILKDGERGDSYRRLLRWFANIALVADPTDPGQIEDAVRSGRMFVAFEIFGTPVGFDVHAVAGGDVTEMGGTIADDVGATLEVTVPTVLDLSPTLPAPEIRARVLRVDQAGVTEVAAGGGPTLSVPLDQPGAYRVEVTMTPHQLGPYLGRLGTDDAEHEQPWIYGNPIYVEPVR